MPRVDRQRFVVRGAALVLLALGICTGVPFATAGASPAARVASEGKSSPRASSLTTIRVAYGPNSYYRFSTAQARHLFQRYGLNVEAISFQSGAASAAAMAAGSIDVAVNGLPGLMSYVNAGADPVWFASEANAAKDEALVARPGSGIRSVRDLVGKKVGTAVGSVGYIGLIEALRAAHVSPSSVDIVNLAPNTFLSSFQGGDVDAIYSWSPMMWQAINDGGKLITTSNSYSADPVLWVARRSFFRSSTGHEALVKFLAAMTAAVKAYPKHKAEVLTYMSQEYSVAYGTQANAVTHMLEIPYVDGLSPSSPWSLTAPQKSFLPIIKRYFQIEKAAGLYTQEPSMTGVFNASVLRDLVKQYGKSLRLSQA